MNSWTAWRLLRRRNKWMRKWPLHSHPRDYLGRSRNKPFSFVQRTYPLGAAEFGSDGQYFISHAETYCALETRLHGSRTRRSGDEMETWRETSPGAAWFNGPHRNPPVGTDVSYFLPVGHFYSIFSQIYFHFSPRSTSMVLGFCSRQFSRFLACWQVMWKKRSVKMIVSLSGLLLFVISCGESTCGKKWTIAWATYFFVRSFFLSSRSLAPTNLRAKPRIELESVN